MLLRIHHVPAVRRGQHVRNVVLGSLEHDGVEALAGPLLRKRVPDTTLNIRRK